MPTFLTAVHLQTSKIPTNSCISHHLAHPKSFSSDPQLKKNISIKKAGHRLVPHGTKTSSDLGGLGGLDLRKIARVARLHSAITNRNVKELLLLAAEECRDYIDLLLVMNPFESRQKVLDMLYAFLVANRMQFVIKPTKDEGVDFGMKWRLEWKEKHLPLGLGCSLDMTHVYEGTVFIRKARNIIEPLLHMEPLGTKLEKIFLPMIDRIIPSGVLEGKRRSSLLYSLLSLAFAVIFLVLLRNTLV